jgi:hypothetical protein
MVRDQPKLDPLSGWRSRNVGDRAEQGGETECGIVRLVMSRMHKYEVVESVYVDVRYG